MSARDNAVAIVREAARAYLPGVVESLRQRAAGLDDPWARAAAHAGVAGLGVLGDVGVGLLADFAVLALDRLHGSWPVEVNAGAVGWVDKR